MWMPLVLIGVHRTMVSGRIRDGVLTGIAVALQALSSLYYGCYLAVYLVPVTLVLWMARGRPVAPAAGARRRRHRRRNPDGAGGSSSTRATGPVLGERPDFAVAEYSATPGDFFEPHPRSRIYEAWSTDGKPERQLFPGFAPMVLSAVALWPPLNVVRLAYASGLAIAVDGALGFNGVHFQWLRDWIPAFRGLRVPARFAIIVSMTLAILASLGAATMFGRWPRWRVPTRRRRARDRRDRTDAAPPARARLVEPARTSTARSARRHLSSSRSFRSARTSWGVHFDATYIYFSTFHWQRLVNGNSGFFPPSYEEFTQRVRLLSEQIAPSSTYGRAAWSTSPCTASS